MIIGYLEWIKCKEKKRLDTANLFTFCAFDTLEADVENGGNFK